MLYAKVTAAAALFVLAGNVPASTQPAIQEPGMVAFYHPEVDVTSGRTYGGYAYGGYAYDRSPYSANAAYVRTGVPARVRPATGYRYYARRPRY